MPDTKTLNKGGLILESFKFSDWSHEVIFGAARTDLEIKPIGRDISDIPVVYQGETLACVRCAVTWIRQYMLKSYGHPMERLSWPYLVRLSGNDPKRGASPRDVLEPARKDGIAKWDTYEKQGYVSASLEALGFKIGQYSFITDYSPSGIYAALQKGPIAYGVMDYQGSGPHFMVASDVTEDGLRVTGPNWWTEDKQSISEVPFKDIEVAVSFAPPPMPLTEKPRIPFFKVLLDKIISFFKYQYI